MVVGRDYLLKKEGRPSAAKVLLDRRLIPFATNAAGRVEVILDRASVHSGVRPSVILAATAGLASLALFWLVRRRSVLPA